MASLGLSCNFDLPRRSGILASSRSPATSRRPCSAGAFRTGFGPSTRLASRSSSSPRKAGAWCPCAAAADDAAAALPPDSGGHAAGLHSLSQLEPVATQLTQLFPAFVLGAVALGMVQPSALSWFHPSSSGSGTLALTGLMFCAGLTCSVEDFKRVLTSPGRMLDGLVLQSGAMPLVACLINRLWGLPVDYAIGFCLVASCPGGIAASLVAYLARADVALNVMMTAGGTLCAAVITPLLTKLLLGLWIPVDGLALASTTAQVVLLPLLAGMTVGEAFPGAAAALRPLCTLCAAALMALVCGSYVAHSAGAVLFAWPDLLLAVAVLHAGGFAAGYAASRALGLPEPTARSNSLQAGMRNSVLAAALTMAHFPDYPLAAIPCAISACMHSTLGSLLAAYWQARPPEPPVPPQAPTPSAVAALLVPIIVRAVAATAAGLATARASLAALLAPPQPTQATTQQDVIMDPLPGSPPPRRRPHNPYAMNVVMVGAECAPWSKTGGLGDVMQALPKALAARGHRVMVVAPRYKAYEDAWETGVRLRLRVFDGGHEVGYFHKYHEGVDYVFVDHPSYHAWAGEIYGGPQRDILFRCALLSKAALEAPWHVPCGGSPYGDANLLFIANDWHTALLPVYLQAHYRDHGQLQFARSLLVLHNMAHQGRGPLEDLHLLELPDAYLPLFRAHDSQGGGDHMNVMKAGATAAHRIVAVSSRYAEECQTPEGGFGLDDVLRKQAWKLSGVVNGIDCNEWSPELDAFLRSDGYCNYSMETLADGKARCKAALQRELGLPVDPSVPLLGFIGRLDFQKGVDLITANYDWLMAQGVQLVLLGSGREDLEGALRDMERRNPQQCRSWVGFSVQLAHRITAGVDLLLMPSRFEPCGLNQLYAMAYGTPPVVHAVGGLHDTVKPFNPFGNTGTGWSFEGADPEAFRWALGNALCTYREHPQSFRGVQLRGMDQDLSWDVAAQQYEALLLAAKYQW